MAADPAIRLRRCSFWAFSIWGVDVEYEAADLLVDAYALPFANGCLDAVLSYAVLENLRDPLLVSYNFSQGW